MAGELVGRAETSILFLSYGNRLKECRRLVHSWINKHAIRDAYPTQEAGSFKLMGALLSDPEHFSQHVRTWVEFPFVWNVAEADRKFQSGGLRHSQADLRYRVCARKRSGHRHGRAAVQDYSAGYAAGSLAVRLVPIPYVSPHYELQCQF